MSDVSQRSLSSEIADEELLFGTYQVVNTLGVGNYEKLKLAFHVDTYEKVAIKVIEKSGVENVSKLLHDIYCVMLTNHNYRHLVKLTEVKESPEHIYLITVFYNTDAPDMTLNKSDSDTTSQSTTESPRLSPLVENDLSARFMGSNVCFGDALTDDNRTNFGLQGKLPGRSVSCPAKFCTAPTTAPVCASDLSSQKSEDYSGNDDSLEDSGAGSKLSISEQDQTDSSSEEKNTSTWVGVWTAIKRAFCCRHV
ncbi:uncharacterized protein LOC128635720 [Bombina bombina]|uniref:uncharacterized protein LOC128635720 n=1 Tax=Bombina bombina TaxID=8345 RepID=UPI00235AA706|nr:uncharacterized protein LOC128635720 [Bombina bombina]